MWFSLKCFRSSSRMAEMAFTMISLCRLTSTPSFMLCSTVVLRQSQPKSGFHPDVIYSAQTSFTFTFHLTKNSYPFKNAANSNVFPFIISFEMTFWCRPRYECSTALEKNLRHLLWQHICKDVDRIRLGFRSRSRSEQDLQQCNLMVSEKGVSDEASTKYAALAS